METHGGVQYGGIVASETEVNLCVPLMVQIPVPAPTKILCILTAAHHLSTRAAYCPHSYATFKYLNNDGTHTSVQVGFNAALVFERGGHGGKGGYDYCIAALDQLGAQHMLSAHPSIRPIRVSSAALDPSTGPTKGDIMITVHHGWENSAEWMAQVPEARRQDEPRNRRKLVQSRVTSIARNGFSLEYIYQAGQRSTGGASGSPMLDATGALIGVHRGSQQGVPLWGVKGDISLRREKQEEEDYERAAFGA
ncbi:hypothetical protein CYMTET_54756 [Cymbomonas tetramitiformis]|uniref:Serine protease n=1 Tax=Cymbomonas tetramitiformis TaxID=36881 RepID=A0AAE0EQE2_9CHLO|nr:hypothetical protein CYMTET_54756 [Cymbomonas tetramitiformis]